MQSKNDRRVLHVALTLTVLVGSTGFAADLPAPTKEMIARWVKRLDSARFGTRESATKRLIRAGAKAIGPVSEAVKVGSLESTTRAIRILSEMSVSNMPQVQNAARLALESIASSQGTTAARRAAEALRNIARAQQRIAIARLSRVGVRIGALSERQLGVQLLFNPFTVSIGRGWKGEVDDLARLAWIYDARMVILEGSVVTDEWLKHVGKMEKVEALIIKKADITDEGVMHLKRLGKLRQLTIKYCSLSNRAINAIGKLEGLTLVKLYGTKITNAGATRLRAALEFANIDHRRGAFLGVACTDHQLGCYVSHVQSGSSADRAGMRINDIIVRYGGKKVSGFKDLTKLISEHKVGDRTAVVVLRNNRNIKLQVLLGEWD